MTGKQEKMEGDRERSTKQEGVTESNQSMKRSRQTIFFLDSCQDLQWRIFLMSSEVPYQLDHCVLLRSHALSACSVMIRTHLTHREQ